MAGWTSYIDHVRLPLSYRTPVAVPNLRVSMSLPLAASSLVLLLTMIIPSSSLAQSPLGKGLPEKPACSPVLSVVSILVRDAEGNAVPGTTVTMIRLRDGKSLGKATEMRKGSGEFALLESDALRWIAATGSRIRLRVRAGNHTVTAVIRVGRDASGCRITKLSGPDVITVK